MVSLILFSRFLKLDLKTYYPSAYSVIGHMLGILMTLTVYHYTSIAFGDNFKHLGVNYFTFIFVAEMSLYIASNVLDFSVRQMRVWKSRGIFDYMLSTDSSMLKLMVLRSLAAIPRDLLIILTQLLMALLFFDFEISAIDLLIILIFPLLALPCFIGLGILALSIMMLTGRSGSAISYISTILSILAGAYFPISVFPLWLQKISFLNPYSSIINPIRSFMTTHNLDFLIEGLIAIIGWNVLLCLIALVAFKLSIKFYRINPRRYTYEL